MFVPDPFRPVVSLCHVIVQGERCVNGGYDVWCWLDSPWSVQARLDIQGQHRVDGEYEMSGAGLTPSKIVVYGHCLVTLPTQLMKRYNGSRSCPP